MGCVSTRVMGDVQTVKAAAVAGDMRLGLDGDVQARPWGGAGVQPPRAPHQVGLSVR
jgi:hypothetical protein